MTIQKAHGSGAYIISQFVGEGAGEYLFTRTYYFSTKAQAVAQFRQDVKGAN